jgi:hypothetical protein
MSEVMTRMRLMIDLKMGLAVLQRGGWGINVWQRTLPSP